MFPFIECFCLECNRNFLETSHRSMRQWKKVHCLRPVTLPGYIFNSCPLVLFVKIFSCPKHYSESVRGTFLKLHNNRGHKAEVHNSRPNALVLNNFLFLNFLVRSIAKLINYTRDLETSYRYRGQYMYSEAHNSACL